MPSLPLRDYAYLAAILIIALGLAWWHHSAVLEGEAKVRASDAKAVVIAQKAVEAQKLTDAKTSADAVQGLKNELQTLRSKPQPQPVRLCVSSPRRALSAPAQPAGGTPSPAPAPRLVPEVPSGAGSGPDLGPELQRLALAADVLAARDRACLEWARGIAK